MKAYSESEDFGADFDDTYHELPHQRDQVTSQLGVEVPYQVVLSDLRTRDIEREIRRSSLSSSGPTSTLMLPRSSISSSYPRVPRREVAQATGAFPTTLILWFAIVSLTVFLKRQSIRPGGRLYKYSKEQNRHASRQRKRRIRDMLSDDLLVAALKRDLRISMGSEELALAELQRLRAQYLGAVDEVENYSHGDDGFDDSTLNGGKKYPALSIMNQGIAVSILLTSSCNSAFSVVAFDLPILDIELQANMMTWIIFGLIVHFIDNHLIINGCRAIYSVRRRQRTIAEPSSEEEQNYNALSEPLLGKDDELGEGAVVVGVPVVL